MILKQMSEQPINVPAKQLWAEFAVKYKVTVQAGLRIYGTIRAADLFTHLIRPVCRVSAL